MKILSVEENKISLSMKALEDTAAEEIQEETIELPDSESIGTSLGSLFQNIRIN